MTTLKDKTAFPLIPVVGIITLVILFATAFMVRNNSILEWRKHCKARGGELIHRHGGQMICAKVIPIT